MKNSIHFYFSACLLLLTVQSILAQPRRDDIYTDFVLYNKRQLLASDLRDRVLTKTFSLSLDSDNEYRYESACHAISQFHLTSPEVKMAFDRLFAQYDSLQYDTKKALLEASYAVYPTQFSTQVNALAQKESDPLLFTMAAAYSFRAQPTQSNANDLRISILERFPHYDSFPVLTALQDYLTYTLADAKQKMPNPVSLFRYQAQLHQKTIYSFQRWDRRYPGLAVVQLANGKFMKNSSGEIAVFEQLALSGSNLPWFITNGNTPQGIYSINGTGVAHNNFIGPTPNLQLTMPFEGSWEKFFHQPVAPDQDSAQMYLQLMPAEWRAYRPMLESWNAGKIGRREIIAHGTTLDPEFFKNEPCYPLTPTMGCLCAKELWNPTTGRLLVSEQFNMVSSFQSTPGNKGYLFVINVDNQQKAMSRAEVEAWVKAFERNH